VVILDRLRLLIETYYDYQKGRIAYYNRLNRLPEEVRKQIENETLFKEIAMSIENLEKSIVKAIEAEVKKEEIYTKFIKRIKGLGPVLGGSLIAWLCKERDFTIANSHPAMESIKQKPYAKIEKINEKVSIVIMPPVLDIAEYPSDVYKYCGVIPGAKRERGKQIDYNPKLKSQFWKIVQQFLKNGKSYYCVIYDSEKAKYLEKYGIKGLADATARKKIARHLLASLYMMYKYLKGQPYYLPYPVEVLGHAVEPPFVDGEDGKPEYLNFLVDKAIKRKKTKK